MASALEQGLSRDAVEELSRLKGEPEWLRQNRLQAWDLYERLPAPQGRRGDLGTLKALASFSFEQLQPFVGVEAGEPLPEVVETSLQDPLIGERSGMILQRNSSVVRSELIDELKSKGVILSDLETAAREHPELVQQYFMQSVPVDTDKYTALHAALWSGGFFLYLPKGVEIEEGILAQVWLDAPRSMAFAHTIIIAEQESTARFVQEYNSAVPTNEMALLSSIVEIYTQPLAQVEFSGMQDLGQNIYHISHKNATHRNDSSVTWVMAELGSKLMYSNIGDGLVGNGSAAEIFGVFFTDHEQRYAIHSVADHQGISTNAETLVKGVLTDSSRVEFEGMIRIRPGAQQTASFLADHTLLLSKLCRAESIPGLEIAANDVSASHGATSGQIDSEQLFYLMSRGMYREEAERIVVQGFFEPVIQRIPLENLRSRLRRNIVSRMNGGYENEADAWVDAQERWEIEDVDQFAIKLDQTSDNDEEIQLSEV